MLAELLPAVSGLNALADDGPDALADRRLGRPAILRAGRRATGVQAPRGVLGIRGGPGSPWAETALEAGAALLAGNATILVPAAPLAGERLRAAFLRGGIPDELLTVAHGEEAAGALAGACARVVSVPGPATRGTMLLLDGAPLERATAGALWAAFAAGGRQTTAVGRLVTAPSVAEPVLAALEQGARGLRVGNPIRPEVEIGPLRSHDDLATVEALVADAVDRGAELLCGGRTTVPALTGAFYAPAVLRRVPADARLLSERPPGPVLAVVEADSEAAAIAIAREWTEPATSRKATAPATSRKATEPTLDGIEAGGTRGDLDGDRRERRARGDAASVWAGDRGMAERVARTLGAEVVWVNEHGVIAPGPALRLARYLAPRQVASRPARLGEARRLPYDSALVRARTAATQLAHGRESERAAVLRRNAIPLARAAARVARDLVRR